MNTQRGSTLIQVVVVMAIVGLLSSITVPTFRDYVERARVADAVGDLATLEIAIRKFVITDADRELPGTLDELLIDSALEHIGEDPWGNAYEYRLIDAAAAARTDGAGDAINTDYDLYSRGPDGATANSLLDEDSADDIVRGNNGAYLGPVTDYPRLP